MQKVKHNLESNPLIRILSGSIARGGSLIFLEEGMTMGAKVLLKLLGQQLSEKISVRMCTLESLLNPGHVQINDLLFLGEIPELAASGLARSCNCKLVKTHNAVVWPSSLFDACWNPFEILPEDLVAATQSALGLKRAQESPAAVALFLDRDDVIIYNVPYNGDPEKVVLMEGIIEKIKQAHDRRELVIVCSNQSGIGRGKLTLSEYQQVHQRLLKLLAEQGAWIDDCYWADYIENSVLQDYELNPELRKPRPGMFLQAGAKWAIDMKKSTMIGDSASDLFAAYYAGVAKLFLLKSEKVEEERITLDNFKELHSEFQYTYIQSLRSV